MEKQLAEQLRVYFKEQYNKEIATFDMQPTKPQFEGDLTLVVFPLLKSVPKKPADLAAELGDYLVEKVTAVEAYNVVQGFLNLQISASYYVDFLKRIQQDVDFGFSASTTSSPKIYRFEIFPIWVFPWKMSTSPSITKNIYWMISFYFYKIYVKKLLI